MSEENENTKDDNKKTKNDKAWEFLFEEHDILEEISRCGFFEIDSVQINKVRESRLMAKFDHHVNLPLIFKKNQISILPISRSRYVLGRFDTYFKVKYKSELEATSIDFPEGVESLNSTDLYSENSALSCAFNTGIIDDLVGEKTLYTISGRMSTNSFDFKISDFVHNRYSINVKNSQCEVDAGFESENYLLLVEAKNYLVDDFLIRQLYYPYRLWSAKVNKKVVPVLMTYSNDVFSFFVYSFEDNSNYNSLTLVEQKNYVIGSEQIQLDDINRVFSKVELVSEPDGVPFPQANSFERVVDLLSLLVEKDLTKDEVTENYQFTARQTDYYTDAGKYLGLVDQYKDMATKEIIFYLTEQGKCILRKRHKLKYLELIERILKHRVFYKVFELTVGNGEIPKSNEICKVMSESELHLGNVTIKRRSQTVRKWIEWIWVQVED